MKKRILIVDDTESNRICLKEMIRHEYETILVSGAAEAIEAFLNGKFDLILSDFEMPGMDGLEMVKQIRGLPDQKGVNIAIIMITGYENINKMDTSGVDKVLQKPLDIQELLNAISSVLAGKIKHSA